MRPRAPDVPYRARSISRSIPTSTALIVRSSSQPIRRLAKVLHGWHAARCRLPEAKAKPLDIRPEKLSHGGSPRERVHQSGARDGENLVPP
jgi:hypothetical protein